MLGPSPANVRRKKPNSRGDLSLLRSDDFFRATAAKSMLPACHFEILLSQLPARSAYRSHPQPLSRSGDDQRASPVAGSLAQHSRSSSGPPLPSGLLRPRDQSTQSDSDQEVCPRVPPDFRSLPAWSCFLVLDHSDHRSRPATFRWACCSSQPLGTINRMRRNAFVVNRKHAFGGGFSRRKYVIVFSGLHGLPRGYSVYKTVGWENVLGVGRWTSPWCSAGDNALFALC